MLNEAPVRCEQVLRGRVGERKREGERDYWQPLQEDFTTQLMCVHS